MSYFRLQKYDENEKYSYKIEKFSGFDAKNSEETMALNYAPYGYNIQIVNGTLREGYGVGEASISGHTIPSTLGQAAGIKKLFLYKRFNRTTGVRDDRLIVLSDEGKLYQTNLKTDTSFSRINAEVSSLNVTFLNCEYNNADCLFVSSDRGEIILYDGTNVSTYTDKPYLGDGCVYNNRVYAVSGSGENVLYVSENLNPTSWPTTGKISFPDEGGKLLRILPYKESLFIFREYAVYRYTGYQGSTGYSLSRVFCSDAPIYAKSAAVCDTMFYFVTGEGFYRYNGSTFEKCWRGIYPLISDLTGCAGKGYQGRYFLTCRIKTEGETVGDEGSLVQNNAVLSIVDENDVSILRGTDITDFVPVSLNGVTEMFLQFNYQYKMFVVGMLNRTGKLFNASLHKKWRSPVSTLSFLQKEKRLRKVFIRPSAVMTLKVVVGDTYEYQLGDAGNIQAVFVNKKADAVGLVLTSTAPSFSVNRIELEFELIPRSIYDK